MALQFQGAPDWLLQDYANRKPPAQIASEGIQQGIQSYIQMKALQQQKQQEALGSYVKAFEAGGPQFAADIAKRSGLQNPPALPGQTATQVTPTGTAGVAQPPLTAGTTPPGASTGTVTSPIIDHWNSSMGQAQTPSPVAPAAQPNPYGINLPVNPLANAGDLLNQGKYGAGQLDKGLKLQEAASKAQEQASKQEESGPKSFEYAKAFASNAGEPDAANAFIDIAKKEGRNTLTKREMDDIKNSINVSAQKGRGQYFETSANIKQQQLRDSLIKEARTTLDPYFQTGAGKQQAERLNRIGRADALLQQMQTQAGGGDTRQMRELATSIASVLTGGNVVAQNQVEELIPQTYKGKMNVFLEKLTNNPTGTEQQAFIKRFADTLEREKGTIQKQARSVAERNAPTLRVLKSQYPEDYDAVVGQYLQHSPEIMGPSSDQVGSQPAIPKVGQVYKGHVFLGGDPSLPTSWKAQ